MNYYSNIKCQVEHVIQLHLKNALKNINLIEENIVRRRLKNLRENVLNLHQHLDKGLQNEFYIVHLIFYSRINNLLVDWYFFFIQQIILVPAHFGKNE